MSAATKTDLEVFLAYCKKRGVEVHKKKDSDVIYVLPPSVVSITFFGMKIAPPEITVYFHEDGRWIGGTNWLWDGRLPWVAQKRRNSRKRMKQ